MVSAGDKKTGQTSFFSFFLLVGITGVDSYFLKRAASMMALTGEPVTGTSHLTGSNDVALAANWSTKQMVAPPELESGFFPLGILVPATALE